IITLLVSIFILICSSEKKSSDSTGSNLSPTLQSYQKAQTILNAGIAALGGAEKIKALENISVEYDGLRHMIKQRRKPEGPWDKEPSTGKIIIDRKNSRLYSLSSNSYPGIGAFAMSWAITGREGFHLDALKNHHGNEVMKLSNEATDWPWAANIRWLPPLLLLQAAENNTSLRWIDSYQKDGRAFEAISFVQPNNTTLVLIFDAGSHLLEGYETVRDDGVYGDVADFIRFAAYQDFNGVKLPTKRTDYLNGEIARELALKISINSPVDENLFKVPEGYVMPKDDAHESYTRIKKIGDGVYIDQDMGGIMIVEFKDFVFVMDCPGNFFMSQSTIDAVRETILNKAIKYVASSHTHGDHAGGARAYFHAGTTLITTPAHVEFYKKLAKIKQTIRPDPFASSQKEPVIETFTDKRVITDDAQTVELYNFGPNAHSEELVIAYLPKQKILWQADIFFIPYTGNEVNAAMPITIEFAKKLKELGITDFDQIIDAHHSRVATRKEFKATLQKAGYEEF
ncbi:MAG: hypothetical protein ACRENG_23670, partial [bacterium]